MKVLTPGHTYEVANFENLAEQGQVIQFIHKEPIEVGSPELKTVADGTTNEELLSIEKIHTLQNISTFKCMNFKINLA